MCPRTKKVNEIVRLESCENLLASSLKVFQRLGYHASSMQMIAKEAGVSKGLAYHYFASKEEILVMLVEKRLQSWLPLVVGLESIPDPQARLKFLVQFVLDELVEKTAELRFFNSLYLTCDGVSAIAKGMKKFTAHFERLFTQEHRLFLDLGYKDCETEATLFRSTLQGISLEYMLGPEEYPLQKIKQLLLSRYI